MTESPLRAASRLVLRDDVYEQLLDLLLDGTFQPGDRLGIEALSRQLSVSPTPVREALATLETTGLIQREALRGYRLAAPLTVAQLNALVDARLAVELAALDSAMARHQELAQELTRVHEEDIRVVQSLGLAEGAEVEFSTYRQYFRADWAFHEAILSGSHNPYLERMGETLGFQVHRLRQAFERRSIDAGEAVAEHAAILAAVREGRPEDAVAAMRTHLEAVRTRSLRDQMHADD